jgi:uncharacterized protein (TIGR03000 family)
MLKKMYVVPLVLSLGCLLVVADSAHAQRRGGVGIGRGYGGYGGGYGNYGNYGYGGYGYGNNSWQRYVAPFVGGGYGNNYYGSGYYGGYNSPYYSGYRSGYYYPSTTYIQPSYDYAPSYAPSYSQTTTQTQTNAQIRVLVPDAQAKVWFDGNPTQQTGTERWFYTPSLQAGANNTYRLRASWMHAGREVTQERVINVNPGQGVTVEFTQTEGSPVPQPKQVDANPTVLDGRVLRTGPDHFVIQSPNQGEVTIYTNPQTRYTLNNNPGAFTDIRVGSNVNFGFTMQGDRRFANTITIRP